MLITTLIAAILSQSPGGPATLCGHVSSFQLDQGERVEDLTGGIHAGVASISMPRGTLEYAESDNLAEPEPRGPWLTGIPRLRVRQAAFRDGSRGYAFYGRYPGNNPGAERERVLVWLSGSVLRFTKADFAILRRVAIGVPEQKICTDKLDYGWPTFLESEK